MADGTMPEKMGEEFDPMAVATSLHRQYRETQLDPAQSIQEMLKTVDTLRRVNADPSWQEKVTALGDAIYLLEQALSGKRSR